MRKPRILTFAQVDALREDHAQKHMVNCSCTIADLIDTIDHLHAENVRLQWRKT